MDDPKYLTELINSNNIEDIVNFMKDNDLILNRASYCNKCKKDMKWSKKEMLSDKFLWRCSTCAESKSIRHASFFSQFDIPLAIVYKDLDKENLSLGGNGEVVEIEESLFVRIKHHNGKDLKREQVWVFGIYERNSRICLF
ncbi:unnamed protein product [Brachionus calyciflorus]|uniref:Uncharacterized protein n=1 Tax=Brachionus calyciflorus TaxID=104777 RepID=A0A814GVE2_9BILA|nr:unnamed protein product [Brachionus calyciflorus]